MKRLLVFNLKTDANDSNLSFTTAWLRALAAHCDAVDVITMESGYLDLPENVTVYSVGKERGYSEPRRAVNFYLLLWRLLRVNRYVGCFAHMMPLFAVMGAPLLKLYRLPIVLWYTHRSVTIRLRLAERLVNCVISASEKGFRLESSKLLAVGHGIDTEMFAPRHVTSHSFSIVTIGRISPVKRHDILIDALAILVKQRGLRDICVTFVGDTTRDADYLAQLKQKVQSLDLARFVTFADGRPYREIPEVYHGADVVVNSSETGSHDKAILEAMSCGVPVVTSNEAFDQTLAAWSRLTLVPHDDSMALADALHKIYLLPHNVRTEIGQTLRQVILYDHSLAKLTTRLMTEIFPALN